MLQRLVTTNQTKETNMADGMFLATSCYIMVRGRVPVRSADSPASCWTAQFSFMTLVYGG